MKVLFAVNNDEISNAILKRYQKDFKEILSYKNVYYFNAILKELQKDKTYDRVVISEDLEPFANNNYDTIDKFLFDKLDSISDEATNAEGNDTQIILICTDRRNKSDNMLNKLFGIGVYSAIVGQDRSIEKVCELINKPRTKKEAKIYYKIEADNVNYHSENEDSVSETEVQNIIAHYKRLGKNEDKYVESFNNIVSQYTDIQLKIIIKYLPIGVRAVLEERSPKYQELVAFAPKQNLKGTYQKGKEEKINKKEEKIKVKMLDDEKNKIKITKPIVIPSGVNSSQVKRLIKQETKIDELDELEELEKLDELKEIDKLEEKNKISVEEKEFAVEEQKAENNDIIGETEQPVVEQKRGRGRPRKNPVPTETQQLDKPKKGRGRPRKNPIPQPDENEKESNEFVDLFNLDDNDTNNEIASKEQTVENEKEIDLFSLDNEETSNSVEKTANEDEKEIDLFDLDDDNDSDEELDLFGLNSDDDSDDELDLFGLNSENDTGKEEGIDLYSLDSDNIHKEEGIDLYRLDDNNMYEEEKDIKNDSIDLFGLDDDTEEETDEILETTSRDEIDLFNVDDDEKTSNYMNNTKAISDAQYKNMGYDFRGLLTKDKKVVTFIGTTKNGTSFVVNNAAHMLASMGISTAILDMTKSKNAYYMYTNNEEKLMQAAKESINKLKSGIADGVKINKNLTVYTSLPEEKENFEDVEAILNTLIKNYSVVLIDCDFDTPMGYFGASQEIYLVQSMDALTIQPLTAFLRNLQSKGLLKQEKIKIVINKEVKIKSASIKTLIGGISKYSDPSMTYMKDLFDKDKVNYCTIPFEIQNYIKYLDSTIDCAISLNGYTKTFIVALRQLCNMIYPLINRQTYSPRGEKYNDNFSNEMNDTLSKMKRKYQ